MRTHRRAYLRVFAAVLVVLTAANAHAQDVPTDPLQCWWRTSAPAVRVGEPFSVVLTCSVLEAPGVKVVPDQSALEPTAVQFPPFESLGGARQADLRRDNRRFFQYEYRMRIISEDTFGKDVKFPETKVSYRVQTQVAGSAIEGRDQIYVLPPLSVRVLSIVPADATDIRDATSATFAAIETRRFRANAFAVTATALFGLAALSVIVGLVRAITRPGRTAVAATALSNSAILGAVGRELASVERDRQRDGWTPALKSRLSTGLRIAAGYALGRPAPQRIAANGASAGEGELFIPRGLRRPRRPVIVSGATTAVAFSGGRQNGSGLGNRTDLLEDLERGLAAITAAQYGRSSQPDESALDGALESGSRIVSRLKREYRWPVQAVKRWRPR